MPDPTKRDKFLDELLDASLREYSRTEPRAGLENRVLRRLDDAPQTSWFTGLHWSAIGAFATVLVVALALFTYPPETRAPAKSVSPGAAADQAAPKVETSAPVVPAPPVERAPRFNKTIQQSGVRPNFSGTKPGAGALPPCKPGEGTAGTAKKGEPKTESKASPDCVPVSKKRPSSTSPQ